MHSAYNRPCIYKFKIETTKARSYFGNAKETLTSRNYPTTAEREMLEGNKAQKK
jgi:hypothetical protein